MKLTEYNPDIVKSLESAILPKLIEGKHTKFYNLIINSLYKSYECFSTKDEPVQKVSFETVSFDRPRKKTNNIRCVILAAYSKNGIISPYVIYYLKKLSEISDYLIYIMDGNLYNKEEASKIKDYVDCVISGRHGRFDFGSWAYGIDYLVKHKLYGRISELILTNDSCYGPIYPLEPIFKLMDAKDNDFWGLTDNFEPKYHISSFFLVLKKRLIHDNLFRRFMESLPQKMDWSTAVKRGELSFTSKMSDKFKPEVYRGSICEKSLCVVAGNGNSTLWPVTSLELKLPLIKVKALTGQYGFELNEGISDTMYLIKDINPEVYPIIMEDVLTRNPGMSAQLKFDPISTNIVPLIDGKKVVSFDIFDTLLIRPLVVPTDLFIAIWENTGEDSFVGERINAESRAREKVSSHEITLDEIYGEMPERLRPYKEVELNEERSVLHLNPYAFKMYQEAVDAGKTIICVSDMYLPSDFLKSVLESNGYTNISHIFVSGECRCNKGSGELFKHVCDVLGITSEEMVHFGDNEISDWKKPCELGIDAYLVRKVLDRFTNAPANVKYCQFFANNLTLSGSIHLALCAEYRYNGKEHYGFWRDFAYCVGGPLAFSYIRFVCESAKKHNCDKLFFVARDGNILQKVYNKYFINDYQIPSEYVYLTRYVGLTSFLDYFDEPTYIKAILECYLDVVPGLTVSESFEDNKAVYKRYYKDLFKASEKYRNDLTKYILKLADSAEAVAIIDMTTGLMSSYRFAKKILGDRASLGIFTGTFKDNPDLIYETFAKRHIVGGDDPALKLSELLISSPEPPILHVHADGTPVYGKSVGIRNEIFNEIELGIYDYCENYLRYFGKEKHTLNMEEWLKLAQSYVQYCHNVDLMNLDNVYDTPTADNTGKAMRISDYILSVRK